MYQMAGLAERTSFSSYFVHYFRCRDSRTIQGPFTDVPGFTGNDESLMSFMDFISLHKVLESSLGLEKMVDSFYISIFFASTTIDWRSHPKSQRGICEKLYMSLKNIERLEQARSFAVAICYENFGKKSGTTWCCRRKNFSG